MSETIRPIVFTINETGTQYTLEFNRESVKFAEDRGFKMDEVGDFPMTKVPELFFYAFRMHHKNVSRATTDKIFEDDFGGVGGLPKGFIERLVQLYTLPFESLNDDEWVDGKNSKVTVEL